MKKPTWWKTKFGRRVSHELTAIGREMDLPHNQPRLQQYNAWGQRVDEIQTCAGWKHMKKVSAEEGLIDEDYGTGFMVAWDLPGHPLPPGYSKYDGKPAIQTGILRDGFDKRTELEFLEIALLEVADDGRSFK